MHVFVLILNQEEKLNSRSCVDVLLPLIDRRVARRPANGRGMHEVEPICNRQQAPCRPREAFDRGQHVALLASAAEGPGRPLVCEDRRADEEHDPQDEVAVLVMPAGALTAVHSECG